MPARKKRTSSRKPARSKQAKTRKTRPAAKRTARPSKPRAPLRKTAQRKTDTTFVYECVRPGCGYRIWRDEKHETGQLRFDLKCPKCHFQVFKCLGQEDDIQTETPPAEHETFDFNTANPVGLDQE